MNKVSKLKHHLDNSISFLLLGTILLIPIFINPFSANIFTLNKTALLATTVSLITILWMIRNITTRSFRFTITPFTLPLSLLFITTLIASYAPLSQFLEGFINFTAAQILLFILFLAGTTIISSKNISSNILKVIVTSGSLLALAAILETINLGPSRWISAFSGTVQTGNGVFLSPAGSAVILITFLIPSLLIALLLAIFAKNYLEKSFLFIGSGLITAALVISIFNILPGKPNSPIFIPFDTAWQVAVENIKNPKAFLIGVGPNNFISAFSKNKGSAFNQNEFWNTRFNVSRNDPLHIFTTTGLLGLTAWFLLVFAVFRILKHFGQLSDTAKIALIAVLTTLIINLLIPNNLVLQTLTIALLMVISLELKHQKHPSTSELLLKLFAIKKVDTNKFTEKETIKGKLKTELLPVIIGIPVILLCIGLISGSFRVVAADLAFRQSLVAATQNNGTQTYNLQQKAVTLNPFSSNYHRAYANTNLAVANALGAQPNLSDQDRANISQLIRQAIREARTGVLINPNDPVNWETLASVYRQLINVADGAQQWATASYTQAIQRDPSNPRLRIELGGIYYQLQDFATATTLFQQAVGLKPDWPNAHYNLANAYREAGQLQQAAAQYEQVISLVDPSTADYSKALEELNAVKKQLGQAEEQGQFNLTDLQEPEPLPSPLPENEQIQLNEKEDAPPTNEQTGSNPSQGGFETLTEQPASSDTPTVESPKPTPESTSIN